MRAPARVLGAALAMLFAAAPATAGEDPAWTVQPDSRVGFTAFQAGAPVEGAFERFEARINFDPAALESSRVEVVIDVASVDSQSKDRDEMIRSANLFDVAVWPEARFQAARFAAKGAGAYEAAGKLTLRDVTRDVVLPFTLTVEDHPEDTGVLLARAQGKLAVKRLDYGVGQGIWTDTSVVADEVEIHIDILATRPKE